MVIWKLSGLALAAVLGSGLAVGQASAMPANGLASAATQAAATNGVQDVRYVCGPYRCWWTPGPYYYGPRYYNHYAGPRPYWGWRRRYW
ncbi:MAG: hypothetical protein ACLP19_13175 [Xanthobacteraceae bacterium]